MIILVSSMCAVRGVEVTVRDVSFFNLRMSSSYCREKILFRLRSRYLSIGYLASMPSTHSSPTLESSSSSSSKRPGRSSIFSKSDSTKHSFNWSFFRFENALRNLNSSGCWFKNAHLDKLINRSSFI